VTALANIHPGEVLLEDYLKPLEMSPERLAQGLRIPVSEVEEILRGERAITAAVALRLNRFFRASPEFWLNLQAAYDLEEEELRRQDELAAIQPYQPSAA